MPENETPPQENFESPALQQNNDEVQPTRDGYVQNIIGAVGCVVVIVVVLAALVIFGVTSFDRIVGGIGGIFGAGRSATVVSSQTILEGILPLGQLVSVSAQLAKVNVRTNVNQGILNTCSYGVNHAVEGTIEAGIDLTQADANTVRYDEARETYVVTLPAPQLTSCRIDFIQQYDWSLSTCNPDWDNARLLANYLALSEFRDDAVEGGILRRAESEARYVIGNFLLGITEHPVEIVFEQPETNNISMPSSCELEPPLGWTYDPSANLWLAE